MQQRGTWPPPDPPSWILPALVRYADQSAGRYPGRLPAAFCLGSGLSMSSARSCYVGLLGICALGDCYAQFLGWNKATLLGLPRATLLECLAAMTAEELDQAASRPSWT